MPTVQGQISCKTTFAAGAFDWVNNINEILVLKIFRDMWINSDKVLAETNHDVIKKLTKKCYPTIADCRENKINEESDQLGFSYSQILGIMLYQKIF